MDASGGIGPLDDGPGEGEPTAHGGPVAGGEPIVEAEPLVEHPIAEETALVVREPERGADEVSFAVQVGVFAALLLFTLSVVAPAALMLWAAIVGAASATGGTALVHTGGLETETFATAMTAGVSVAIVLLLGVGLAGIAPRLPATDSPAARARRARTWRGVALATTGILIVVSFVTALAASRRSPWFPYPIATVAVVATVGFIAVVVLLGLCRVSALVVRWVFRWAVGERYRAGLVTGTLLLAGLAGVWAQHAGWAQRPLRWAWDEMELDRVRAPSGFADAGERLFCLGAGEVEPARARSAAAPACSFLPPLRGAAATGRSAAIRECFEALMPARYESVVNQLAVRFPRETARDAASQAMLDTCRSETVKRDLDDYFFTAALHRASRMEQRGAREVACDDLDERDGACVSPLSAAQLSEIERMVVCRLNGTERSIVELWLAGLSMQEIGEVVDMARARAKDTLFNALKRLAHLKDRPLTDCVEP